MATDPQTPDGSDNDLDELGQQERDEFLRRLDQLEREAAAKLNAEPLHAVRDPMPMPEVLRERPAPPPARAPHPDGDRSDMGQVWAIGTQFASMVIGGGLVGWAVDYFFPTAPWGVLTGLLLGLLIGGVQFIRSGLAANRQASERYGRR